MRVTRKGCSITIIVPFVVFVFSSSLLADVDQNFLEGQDFGNLKNAVINDVINSMEINTMDEQQVDRYYSDFKSKPAASVHGYGYSNYKSNNGFEKIITKSEEISVQNIGGVCSSGDCVHETQASDLQPEEALSNLAAINDAKPSRSNTLVFTGELMKCRKVFAGFRNCCANTGWGKNIGSECSNEEKDLAGLVEDKQCHYLGQYCAKKNRITNSCIEKKKSYCCYSSMLSRVVQDNAHIQLNLYWKSPKKEKCLGISPDTLSKLDFSKINFSEYYARLNSDVSQKSNQIEQSISTLADNIQVAE